MATGGQSYRLAIHYPLNNEGDVTKRVRVPWGERNIQSLANNGREWIKGYRYLRKTGERMRKKKYFFYPYVFLIMFFFLLFTNNIRLDIIIIIFGNRLVARQILQKSIYFYHSPRISQQVELESSSFLISSFHHILYTKDSKDPPHYSSSIIKKITLKNYQLRKK